MQRPLNEENKREADGLDLLTQGRWSTPRRGLLAGEIASPASPFRRGSGVKPTNVRETGRGGGKEGGTQGPINLAARRHQVPVPDTTASIGDQGVDSVIKM